MGKRYSDGVVPKLIRLPKELKERVDALVPLMNQRHPGANYTAESIIRAGTERIVEEMEKELNPGK